MYSSWFVFFILLSYCSVGRNFNDIVYVDSDEEYDLFTTSTSEPLPYFDHDHSNFTNVTAPLGSTAFLHCRVNLLGDKTVSWIKKDPEGVRLLTFGMHTYSDHDDRLSINFEKPNNWKLRIQSAQATDQGKYHCQVSSHPPVVLLVHLTIIVPHISIVDDLDRPIQDKFYNAGSTIELRCIINYSNLFHNILWKRGHIGNMTILNYDTSRGSISVKTTIFKEKAISVLFIANAMQNDSMAYACNIGNFTQSTIHVHVVGELQAAMQHSSSMNNELDVKSLCLYYMIFFIFSF